MNAIKIVFALCICVLQTTFVHSQSIVSVSSADKNVISVIVETPNGVSAPTQSVSSWQVNGTNPSQVGRYTYVYKEEKESGGNYSMSLRHHMYIRLASNLSNGTTYNINTPYGSNQFVFNDEQTRCESIHSNQSGYFGNSSVRYANMNIFLGDMGAQTISTLPTYKVLNSSGGTVTTGTVTNIGNDASAGGQVYRINLANVPNGGPYRISVAGYGCSYPFGVGPTYSAQNANVHVRGLYHQRCGIALEEPYTSFTRPVCHTSVQVTDAQPYDFITQTSSTVRNISGGYHDAGDFDRRAVHAMIPAWMLNTYEAFPAGFTDNQYNIPESGNGIPDFLDEALWGLKIWEELQESDGAVRGGTEANAHPTYGVVNAATDNLVYRTYKRWGYTTAMGAGLFAHASRLVQPFNATRAAQLLAKAQNAWNYLQAHSSDADMATAKEGPKMYAAMELYLATGDANYHTAFQTHATNSLNEQIRVDWFNIPSICDEGLVLTPYFFGYLTTTRPVNQTLKDAWTAKLQGLANNSLSAMTKPYPIGDNPNYAWGTATNQGRYADPIMLMYRLNSNPSYLDAISQMADYSLGLNPLGKVYVTGLGVNQPTSPLHLDSYFTNQAGKGNVPGIVIYGPADYSSVPWQLVVWEKVYPAFPSLPLQRRFTDGWSLIEQNEFTTWETQAENACMYGFLASVDNGGTPPPTPPTAPSALSATAASSSQINLSWTDNASNETGFKIERKTGSGGTYAQISTVGANVTSYNNTGLSAATNYYYRVRATNAGGDSGYSNETNATTQSASVPSAPNSLTATSVSISQINLSWTDNASNETGFKIERKTGSGGTYAEVANVGANVNSYSNTGLSVATTYYYRVRGTNGAGDSGYSNEANATTQTTGSGSFTSVNIGTASNGTTIESSGVITVSVNSSYYIWSDNDAFRYVYQDNLSGNVTMIARVDNLTGTGDAEAGIMMRKSTATNSSNYGIFISADGNIKVTYRNSTWSIQDYTVSGSAPKWLKLEKVGTTITAFTSDNGTVWTSVASENMNATLSDTFTAGLAVASGNISNNASANFSNVTWPITVPSVPTPPSALSATATSSSQINLAWTDNSSNETGFKIERKNGSGGTYAQIATVGANVTSYNNTGLSATTNYYYRVRATNAGGDSGYGNEVNATTQAGLPTAPSALSATVISSSQINLSWTDNASNETGFKIERKTGSGGTYAQIATVGANVTSYNNTGLSATTTYYYRVRATNAGGDSGYGNEANATTQAGLPTAPSALSATVISSSQINLSWTDNASNETGFKIERKTGSGGTYAQIATVGANVNSYNNTGLSAATTYYYRVRATNTTGDSGYGNEANATTQTVGSGLFISANIGTVSNGVTNESSGVLTISVNSSYYIWSDNDAFRYVYQDNLSGNVTLIARVDNLTGTGDAEAGIMLRKSTSTNSSNYGIFVLADGNIKATFRNTSWTIQDYTVSGSAPKWFKLEKVGTTVTAFTSNNGTIWTNVASENMNASSLSDTFTAGLAVASGNINNNASANFSNITWPDQGSQSALIGNDINAKSNRNSFVLNQNYPNPFDNSTAISYEMEEEGDVELKIFDISGRIIWSMNKQNQLPGHHTFEWNVENHYTKDVEGGMYFYQIRITTATTSFIDHRKMFIAKSILNRY